MNTNIFTLTSKPGVKRDGTELDNDFYQVAQWVRFQRGKPRKMGGYKSMSPVLTGPIRNLYVDSRALNNTAHAFSPWGVQQLTFDNFGAGAGIIDRTPSGFVKNDNFTWQSDAMFNSGGGGDPVIIAAATPDMSNIADDALGNVYSGIITASGAFTQLTDGTNPIRVSGGCCVLQPFLFVYGSDGLIKNSNANNIDGASAWIGTDANEGNFAATKFVKGMPIRGGANSPAGLFWSLDSLLRVTYVGGTVRWKYDPLGAITVLSKSAMVEYDSNFFWPGADRFYAYTGVIQELPNDMSLNYFYDNLNYNQAQKIWALKVPRWGEIWWFYPSGVNTECDKAVIFNVREKTWYDAELVRTAGFSAQVFRYPVMAGGEDQVTTLLSYTTGVGTFNTNEVVTGGTSGAQGRIKRILPGKLNVQPIGGTFVNGETISNAGATATGTLNAVPVDQTLTDLWQHEVGYDRVKGQDTTAIRAYFETCNFQLQTGGPVEKAPQGAVNQQRLVMFEPDFKSSGDLTVTINGRQYAQAPNVASDPEAFTPTTEYVALREQRRQMSVMVESNTVGGHFEMGRVLMTVEPGDGRP